MKTELERMENKQVELQSRKGTLATQMKQAKAGGGAEGLGARGSSGGAFAEFRRMEEKVEGHVAEVAAHREVEDALGGGGMSELDLESKFAALESGARGGSDDKPGGKEVDDELAALKKKVRIGT
jgi:phage shock protein A